MSVSERVCGWEARLIVTLLQLVCLVIAIPKVFVQMTLFYLQ